MNEQLKYLDPLTLAKIRGLELRARLVVEGYLSGLHKSPNHGFSVEFAQHREYVPGDDLKHVDWKVYGRTERFFLKQYQEETNLACWLLVDVSGSMRYGSGGLNKYDYASTVAASLAYLILRQQDSVGLITFDDRPRRFLRPSSEPAHLREVVRVLNHGPAREKSLLAPVFHEVAERISRRGLIMVLSDLFEEVDDFLAGLKHLRYKGHEVVAFHVIDPAELDFPFLEMTLFRGLESAPEILTDPRSLRRSYMAEIHEFLAAVQRGCGENKVDYVRLRTDSSLAVALSSYLAQRLTRKR
jgi:uncharacterized protein (DUF58 family)